MKCYLPFWLLWAGYQNGEACFFTYKGEQIQIVPNLRLEALMILFSYLLFTAVSWFADDFSFIFSYSCKGHRSVWMFKQI